MQPVTASKFGNPTYRFVSGESNPHPYTGQDCFIVNRSAPDGFLYYETGKMVTYTFRVESGSGRPQAVDLLPAEEDEEGEGELFTNGDSMPVDEEQPFGEEEAEEDPLLAAMRQQERDATFEGEEGEEGAEAEQEEEEVDEAEPLPGAAKLPWRNKRPLPQDPPCPARMADWQNDCDDFFEEDLGQAEGEEDVEVEIEAAAEAEMEEVEQEDAMEEVELEEAPVEVGDFCEVIGGDIRSSEKYLGMTGTVANITKDGLYKLKLDSGATIFLRDGGLQKVVTDPEDVAQPQPDLGGLPAPPRPPPAPKPVGPARPNLPRGLPAPPPMPPQKKADSASAPGPRPPGRHHPVALRQAKASCAPSLPAPPPAPPPAPKVGSQQISMTQSTRAPRKSPSDLARDNMRAAAHRARFADSNGEAEAPPAKLIKGVLPSMPSKNASTPRQAQPTAVAKGVRAPVRQVRRPDDHLPCLLEVTNLPDLSGKKKPFDQVIADMCNPTLSILPDFDKTAGSKAVERSWKGSSADGSVILQMQNPALGEAALRVVDGLQVRGKKLQARLLASEEVQREVQASLAKSLEDDE